MTKDEFEDLFDGSHYKKVRNSLPMCEEAFPEVYDKISKLGRKWKSAFYKNKIQNPLKSLTTRLSIRVSLNHFESLCVALSHFESLWVALSRFESHWVALRSFELLWVALSLLKSQMLLSLHIKCILVRIWSECIVDIMCTLIGIWSELIVDMMYTLIGIWSESKKRFELIWVHLSWFETIIDTMSTKLDDMMCT